MEPLKIAAKNFTKNYFTSLFLIIEIAAVFVAVNFLCSAVEGRKMQLKTFENLLSENSLVVCDINSDKNSMLLGITTNESKERLLSVIQSDYSEYEIKTTVVSDEKNNIMLYICPEEIIENFAMPLSSGRKPKDATEAIASYHFSRGEKLLSGNSFEFQADIVGICTVKTYVPDLNSISSQGMTVKDLYTVKDNKSEPFILVNENCFDFAAADVQKSKCSILFFENGYANDLEYLSQNSIVIESSKIYADSKAEIYKDLKNFYPIILSMGIIVLIGIICFTVIVYKENAYNNGVMCLCGASVKEILGILTIQTAIMVALSAVLAMGISSAFNIAGVYKDTSLIFGLQNIIVLSTISAVVIILPSAFVYAYTVKNPPIDIMRRSL